MIKKISIYGSGNGKKTGHYVEEIIESLAGRNVEISLFRKLEDCIPEKFRDSVTLFDTLPEGEGKPDLMLSVGGDGTFLKMLPLIKDKGIPVAGVNAGRLGFLSNIHDDIKGSMDNIFEKRLRIIDRSLLELIEPAGALGDENIALNDITIQKSDLNMISIKIDIDDMYLNTYWADGLIISTATGSTAYNLSTGGPILVPEDESIIISPLSPHNLTVRPVVIPGKSNLHLTVEGRGNGFLVTCDFRSVRLSYDKKLVIRQAGYKFRTINDEGHNFFSTLRNKLMWGADPRN